MIGIDLVDMKRIRLDPSLIRHVLVAEERQQMDALKSEERKKEYLAGRFACKEALFKAAGEKNWLNYCILDAESGKPYVKDHPELEVSISHDGGFCIAIAIQH